MKKVVVLMGGWSSERDVSLVSGTEVAKALTQKGYNVATVDVTQDLSKLLTDILFHRPDVIFNALHGVGGEDGTIQGALSMLHIPYTNSDVCASALAMNKVLSRKIFEYEHIPTPRWLLIQLDTLKIADPMPFPYVIKPINEGSSRGVFIVNSMDERKDALKNWNYGDTILIEAYIPGREIHVAIIDGKAVGAIEVCPKEGFYDYTNKYTPGKADHVMPAPMPQAHYDLALEYAEKAHTALQCRDVTRADFRYDDTGTKPCLYLLELNTQPGLTPLSLVPEIAAHAGISFEDLAAGMIQRARC